MHWNIVFPSLLSLGILFGCNDAGTNGEPSPAGPTQANSSLQGLLDSLGVKKVLPDSVSSLRIGGGASSSSEMFDPADTFQTTVVIAERTSHFPGDSLFVFAPDNHLLVAQPVAISKVKVPLATLPLGVDQLRFVVVSDSGTAIWDTLSVTVLGITITDTLRDTASLGFAWKRIPASLLDSIEFFRKSPWSSDSVHLGTVRHPDSLRFFLPQFEVLNRYEYYTYIRPHFRGFGLGKTKYLAVRHLGAGPSDKTQGSFDGFQPIPGSDRFFVRMGDSLRVVDYRTWTLQPFPRLGKPSDIEYNAAGNKALLAYCDELVELRLSDFAVEKRHPIPNAGDSCIVQADYVDDSTAVLAREGDDFGDDNLRLFRLSSQRLLPFVASQEYFTPDLKVTENGKLLYAGETGLTASTMTRYQIEGDSLKVDRRGGLDEDVPRGVFLLDGDSTIVFSDKKFSAGQFGTGGSAPRAFYPGRVDWISPDGRRVFMDNVVADRATGKEIARFPVRYDLIPTSNPDLVLISWDGNVIVYPYRLLSKP